jgi:hypothetical protein
MRILPSTSLALALALSASLLTACDKPEAPSESPPAQPEAQPEAPAPEDGNDSANFATPPEDPPAPTTDPPAEDPELNKRVKAKFGEQCRYERSCGELIGIDCNSAADGPYYYANKASLETVSTCGGACMGGRCTDCPPKAWTCATY